MAYQAVFERYEMKYIMTKRQRKAVLEAMLPFMRQDDFGHTTIRNVYFDTDQYRLARHSVEKPIYKEKFRIRSYKQVGPQDSVFIELKKKYCDVVYKRRESLTQLETLEWIVQETPFPKATQIGNEIDYFFEFYQTLKPKIFLSYERDAFCATDGSDFRVTLMKISWLDKKNFLSQRIFGAKICCQKNISLWNLRHLTVYRFGWQKC